MFIFLSFFIHLFAVISGFYVLYKHENIFVKNKNPILNIIHLMIFLSYIINVIFLFKFDDFIINETPCLELTGIGFLSSIYHIFSEKYLKNL
jgi:hypothetical protein